MSHEFEPQRPRPASHPVSNLATALALMAILLVMLALLALMAFAGLPFVLIGVLGVVTIGALTIGFHYVTWGWWLSQLKDDED